MNPSRHCAIVVPACNEAKAIGAVVQGARRYVPTVFVVNDGSADATASLARSGGAQVISQARSGKGAALQAGFKAATEAGFAWALAMDGDGQHDPNDIPLFLRAVEGGNARMLVGNRFHDLASMPRLRRWVNRWMSRQICGFCGTKLLDTQCGFRMLDLKIWSRLPILASHFEIESELLVRFSAAGFRVGSVPISVRYAGERSKINPLPDTLRWFKWWMRIRRELGPQTAVWEGSRATA